MSPSTLELGWLNVVGQVDAVSASLLRHVSRIAVINCLEVPWRLIRQVLLPIDVPLMSGPCTISPAFAEAPAAGIRRLVVICPITMGPCPFLQLKPRLRGGLGQTHERVLHRPMDLLSTAVAMQVLVNGPEAASRSWPERGWEGQRMILTSSGLLPNAMPADVVIGGTTLRLASGSDVAVALRVAAHFQRRIAENDLRPYRSREDAVRVWTRWAASACRGWKRGAC